jgi:hypothetical protein
MDAWRSLWQEYEAKAGPKMAWNYPGPEVPEAARIVRTGEINAHNAAVLKPMVHEYSKKLEQLLTPAQLVRLKQLQWQGSGYRAYRNPEVARQMGLTTSQREKLEAIWAQSKEHELRLVYGDAALIGSPDVENTLAKMRRLYQERETSMEEVVTREQKKRFESLLGKPFKWPPEL